MEEEENNESRSCVWNIKVKIENAKIFPEDATLTMKKKRD